MVEVTDGYSVIIDRMLKPIFILKGYSGSSPMIHGKATLRVSLLFSGLHKVGPAAFRYSQGAW